MDYLLFFVENSSLYNGNTLETYYPTQRFKHCGGILRMTMETMESLTNLKTRIEQMNKHDQIEILKILSKQLCKINENKSGVYINLAFLSPETITDIQSYLDYIQEQECSFNTLEYQKEEFKNAFFIEKEDKDNKTISYSSLNK